MSSFLEPLDRRITKAEAEADSIRVRHFRARWGVWVSWVAIVVLAWGVAAYFVVAGSRASLPVSVALIGGFVIIASALRAAARYFRSESQRLAEALKEYEEFLKTAKSS